VQRVGHAVGVSEPTPPPAEPRPRLRILGPRGIQGLFGWTFFDPANLVSVVLLLTSAVLVVLAMRAREAPDWGMAVGLYTCIFLFLRGYFFNYYHGRAFGRITVVLILLLALVASAALWEDAAPAHQALRAEGVRAVPRAEGFHIAALLHLVVAVALFIHVCLPRRWVIRATDELADRTGRDAAHDAPIETIDDPAERARRLALQAQQAQKKKKTK
jgi:hypothetical protein